MQQHAEDRARRRVRLGMLWLSALLLLSVTSGAVTSEGSQPEVTVEVLSNTHSKPAPAKAGGKGASGPKAGGFEIKAVTNATGMYPGRTSALSLKIENPNGFPITISEITARVSATSGPTCPTTDLLLPNGRSAAGDLAFRAGSGTFQPEGLTVPARGETLWPYPVRMSTDPADGCQAADFTITYTVTAVKA